MGERSHPLKDARPGGFFGAPFWRIVPNILSIFRIILTPVFVMFIIYEKYQPALVTYAVAGVSDVLDGFIARRAGKTEIGAYLDPLADKLLVATSFIALFILDVFPLWFIVLVIGRDMVISAGAIFSGLTKLRSRIPPSPIGKATTFFQVLTVCLGLGNRFVLQSEAVNLTYIASMAITAVLTVFSGLHYAAKWIGASPDAAGVENGQ